MTLFPTEQTLTAKILEGKGFNVNSRYLSGVALGALIGFQLSTGAVWLLGEDVFLSQHAQNLVAVSAALIAAVVAIVSVSRQIQSNVDLAERNRQAQLDAAKSVLPMVLSNIHEICKNRCNAASRGEKEPRENQLWTISDFEISTLKECIQHAQGNEKIVMQHIVRVYQVLVARWERLVLKNLTGEAQATTGTSQGELANQYVAILNWATLQAISVSLFAYARSENSDINLTQIKSDIWRLLRRIGVDSISSGPSLPLVCNSEFTDFIDFENQSTRIEFIDGSTSLVLS